MISCSIVVLSKIKEVCWFIENRFAGFVDYSVTSHSDVLIKTSKIFPRRLKMIKNGRKLPSHHPKKNNFYY
jgi:hypothetical protein